MEEWKSYKLSDVTDSIGDGIHGTPKYDEDGSYFFINGNNLENGKIIIRSSTKRVSEEEALKHRKRISERTILVSINGTLGNTARYNYERCILGKSACYLNVKEDVDIDFIYYVVTNKQFKDTISRLATGTTIKNVSLETMRNYEFFMPSLENQKKISSILKSIDDKIAINCQINDNLEQQASNLFQDWLNNCENSIMLRELTDNVLDYTPNTHEHVYLLNSSDVTEGQFTVLPLTPNINLKGQFKKRFKKGDILYSEIRPRNRHYAYCYFDADKYIASTRLIVLRAKPEKLTSSILLYQYLMLNNVFEEFTLKTESRSGTFPQGNYEDLSSIKVPYGASQEKIAKALESIYKQLWTNLEENERLEALRDSLLPKLMSGELKINEIDC